MASLITLYWRDIPSQVIVKSGRQAAKRELSERFIRAIDAAAMHAKAKSADAYLDDWRRSDPVACGDDIESEAEAAAARLEGARGEPRHGGASRPSCLARTARRCVSYSASSRAAADSASPSRSSPQTTGSLRRQSAR